MEMSFQHVEPFAFDRVFSIAQADAANTTEDSVYELMALRAELVAVRADGAAQVAVARAEGFDAGLAQARGARDAALLIAVDALQAGVETIESEFAGAVARVTGE